MGEDGAWYFQAAIRRNQCLMPSSSPPARTPIGRAGKGSLNDVRPDDMLAFVIKEVVAKSGVDPADIDDVIAGCRFPHGEQG